MQKLLILIGAILISIIALTGQNYIGLSQSKIVKQYGQPNERGSNYVVYNRHEKSKNIFYFDKNDECIALLVINQDDYFEGYQKMLENCSKISTVPEKTKSAKLNFSERLTLSLLAFQNK